MWRLPRPLDYFFAVLSAAALLACTAAAAYSQSALASRGYHTREWHLDDGLPSEDITQLLQDRKGYLWVATRGGVARFDGSEFVTPRDPQGSGMFLGINEDGDGSLTFIPRSGSPLRYRNGKFTPEPLPEPYKGQAILSSFISDDGIRWFSVNGAILRVGTDHFDVFSEKEGIAPQGRSRFGTDEKKRLWVSSGSRILRWENSKWTVVPFESGGPEPRIASSRHGGPWVITDNKVYKLDEADRPMEIASVPPLIGAHYLTSTCEDGQGNLWVGTRSQGVFRINKGSCIHVPTSHDDVYAITEDRDGTIWVGINSGGLNAITPKIYRLYDKSFGLTENATYSLCEDRNGDMWLGNGDGGLARIHQGEVHTQVTRYESRIFGVISVSPSDQEGVWFTGAPGLFHADQDSSRFSHVDTVPAPGIRRITYVTKNGDLWVSVDPDRVGRLREGKFETFGPTEGFTGRDARAIVEDSHGKLWIGTSDGQIFNYEGRRFESVSLATSRPTGGINAIHFSDNGATWIGTAQAGIVVLSAGQAITLGLDQGLPGEDVTQIVRDRQGDFWCGSSRGIFRLQRAEAEQFIEGKIPRVGIFRLGKDEGLRAAACTGIYGPAATASHDGRIWFATRQGVLSIDPTAPVLAPTPPVVAIEEIRCNDELQPLRKPFTVRGDNRKLEIRFSVLCLSAPSRAQTRYRLEGFDADWVYAGNNHTASYPRLPPGEYIFSVRSGFSMSDRSQSVDTMVIIVPPLWWQRTWIQAGSVVLLIAGITAAARGWAHRRLRLKLEKLERETAVARERARIAQNIHDDVGASLTRISLLTQAASPEALPQSSNLARIYETTREITRSLDEIVWAVNPQYDSLESFVDYLTNFAQKFLSVAGIRCRLQIPADLRQLPITSQTRHDLFLCCREALNNVVQHSHATEVVLSLSLEAGRLVVRISDNGRGLDASGPAVDRVSSGHGQKNMQERMHSIGGTCRISAAPGGGVVVTLELDINLVRPPHTL